MVCGWVSGWVDDRLDKGMMGGLMEDGWMCRQMMGIWRDHGRMNVYMMDGRLKR